MRKLFQRMSKRTILTLDVGIALLLLLALWVLLDYPAITAAGAFRRGLRAANLPQTGMELRVNDLGLAADGENCMLVRLGWDRGWRYYDAWTVPAAEGQLWAPLNWNAGVGSGAEEEAAPAFAEDLPPASAESREGAAYVEAETLPAFAVKTDEEAGLSLILYGDPEPGSLPEEIVHMELVPLERKAGWLVFGFDLEYLRAYSRKIGYYDTWEPPEYEFEAPCDSLVRWMRSSRPGRLPAQEAWLELSWTDGAGTPQTLRWALH